MGVVDWYGTMTESSEGGSRRPFAFARCCCSSGDEPGCMTCIIYLVIGIKDL